jgi:hypothetical protein
MKSMKYLTAVALAGTIVWLTGCASASRVVVVEPVGPVPTGEAQVTSDGSLAIYSARTQASVDVNAAEWQYNNDFGKNEFLYEPAHTDYTIYTQKGDVFRRVRNARDPNDQAPALVTLPAGSYKVEAEGLSCDSSRVNVLMPVVIKPGQATIAHLEGDWNPPGQYQETELATLPCGRIIGWRAPVAGFASTVPISQAN